MTPIKFDQVSKRYCLRPTRYQTLSEKIPNFLMKPFSPNSNRQTPRARNGDLFALKNLSFEVQPGEALGIIGPNGAGKSTILKLISRIMLPTEGQVLVHGRVGPLIEIGAGFHPELTGRDNIYLNGSILGMKKNEINAKFKIIVDFAELWDFIDIPIKRYSSGMRVRLAFAVSAYIDVDILLVDEVLAVGDLSFQRKCLDKIKELRDQQMTLVYVSHQLDTVIGLCDRAIYLDGGEIIAEGEPKEVIKIYQNRVLHGRYVSKEEETRFHAELLDKPELLSNGGHETGEVELLRVRFLDEKGNERDVFSSDEKIVFRVEFFAKRRITKPVYSFSIIRSDGVFCCGSKTKYDGINTAVIEGSGSYEIEIEKVQLNTGIYLFSTSIYDEMINVPYAFRRLGSFRVETPLPLHLYKMNVATENIAVFTPAITWRKV